MGQTYVKMNRDSILFDVLKKSHDAFVLWTVIAYKASVFGNPIAGLEPGEALVGDHKEYGMTRQRYRTALKNLEKWGVIAQKPTTKGTVVKLIDTRLFDINQQEPNHQPTIEQPSSNHQLTTINNKEERKKTTSVVRGKSSPPTTIAKKKYPEVIDDYWNSGDIENMMTAWREAYPAVDLKLEISKAKAWLLANPTKRKTAFRKFINSWLSRAQERGGSTFSNGKPQQPEPVRHATEIWRD